jgi:hypothetical protein
MSREEVLASFLELIPAQYPEHMLCYFASNAARGVELPFLSALVDALELVDRMSPGYAREIIERIAAIRGTGEDQYEAILSILAEVYVTAGLAPNADRDGDEMCFNHEPAIANQKNPEFEIRVDGDWCVIEVKAARLIDHGHARAQNPMQVGVRLPRKLQTEGATTLPRDNPIKDFLVSADEKFKAYEQFRPGALRILVIVWDDFCNEPIAALTSPISGLLTETSFFRDDDGQPVEYPHIDGIVVVRHQHQIIRATRCEPLIDGVSHAFDYGHTGFPPKAYLGAQGGREPSKGLMKALNAMPLENCLGAEYQPVEMIMWFGGGDQPEN